MSLLSLTMLYHITLTFPSRSRTHGKFAACHLLVTSADQLSSQAHFATTQRREADYKFKLLAADNYLKQPLSKNRITLHDRVNKLPTCSTLRLILEGMLSPGTRAP